VEETKFRDVMSPSTRNDYLKKNHVPTDNKMESQCPENKNHEDTWANIRQYTL